MSDHIADTGKKVLTRSDVESLSPISGDWFLCDIMPLWWYMRFAIALGGFRNRQTHEPITLDDFMAVCRAETGDPNDH